ncbi:MAG: L-threonylcarbamoyladenylate synthase [Nanoarchaeota archaeon]|nr:L-threonylcarbamoyladenylate synthase [Nanoarchaeota archaeon]
MEIVTQAELRLRLEEILEKIEQGALFIYPTDTIYGIGCNALHQKSVEKLRQLKQGRPTAPFSIWVPSLQWVEKNCVITKQSKQWLEQLPGPITIILNIKNKKAIANNVAPGIDSIGIRYPDHWFGKIVEMIGTPIITTSANKTGDPFMTSIENLDSDIHKSISFIIYEGPKEGRPSKIVNASEGNVRER